MIKIINGGTRKIAKCSACGCVFSYEEEDIHTVPRARYLSIIHYIRCPQCNKAILIMIERGKK